MSPVEEEGSWLTRMLPSKRVYVQGEIPLEVSLHLQWRRDLHVGWNGRVPTVEGKAGGRARWQSPSAVTDSSLLIHETSAHGTHAHLFLGRED